MRRAQGGREQMLVRAQQTRCLLWRPLPLRERAARYVQQTVAGEVYRTRPLTRLILLRLRDGACARDRYPKGRDAKRLGERSE